MDGVGAALGSERAGVGRVGVHVWRGRAGPCVGGARVTLAWGLRSFGCEASSGP